MRNRSYIGIVGLVTVLAILFSTHALAVSDKIVIGHPACLSGKYAKAGEQAVGGIRACVDWVNNTYGGVRVGGKKLPLEYKYYDCESKKDAVTSLISRLITVDKVDCIFAPYSSGLTLRGAPVAESRKMLYMDHGGANNKIFQQGFRYIIQTIGPATRYHKGTLDMIHEIDPK
ncbi:MAG: ABC transporter substrate-binding protein, partial [Desulfobacterales bacterium]